MIIAAFSREIPFHCVLSGIWMYHHDSIGCL